MKKRILSLLLAFVMLAGMLPVNAFAAFTEGGSVCSHSNTLVDFLSSEGVWLPSWNRSNNDFDCDCENRGWCDDLFGWNLAASIAVDTNDFGPADRIISETAYNTLAGCVDLYLGNIGDNPTLAEIDAAAMEMPRYPSMNDLVNYVEEGKLIHIDIGGYYDDNPNHNAHPTLSSLTVDAVNALGLVLVARHGLQFDLAVVCCDDHYGFGCDEAQEFASNDFYQDEEGNANILVISENETFKEITHRGLGEAWLMLSLVTGAQYQFPINYYVDGKLADTDTWTVGSPVEEIYEPAPVDGYDELTDWVDENGDPWTPPEVMPGQEINVYCDRIPNEYDITYIVDEEEVHEDTFAYKQTLKVWDYTPEVGYAFSGWYTDPELENAWNAPATMPHEDITVYGETAPIDYTITYIVDGEPVGTEEVPFATDISEYDQLHLPELDEYHHFDGWYTDSKCTTPWEPDTMGAGDLKVYGKILSNNDLSYTVYYYEEGTVIPVHEEKTVPNQSYGKTITESAYTPVEGFQPIEKYQTFTLEEYGQEVIFYYERLSYTIRYKVDGEPDKVDTYDFEDPIDSYAPAKTGYTFDGWYADEDLTQPTDLPETMPAENIVVYGKFVPVEHTITYVVDGEQVHEDAFAYKQTVKVWNYSAPVGYDFDGWYTDPALENAWKAPATMPNEDITVYGETTPIDYTITYIIDGNPVDEQEVPFGTDISDYDERNLPEVDDHHHFDGWYTDSRCTTPWDPDTMGPQDIVVYGKVVPNTDLTYTVYYFEEGTTNPVHEEKRVEGLNFGDAVTEYAYTPVEGFQPIQKYQTFTVEQYDQKIIFYYERLSYTLTYKVEGDPDKVDTYKFDAPIDPYAPEKTGYTFNGWYEDPELTQPVELPETMPAENVVVYGAFEPIDYTITYKVEGAPDETDTYHYGDPVDPYAPEKPGYAFGGWYADPELTTPWEAPETMPDEDIVVYGQFIPLKDLSYTVHYYITGTTISVHDDKVVTGLPYGTVVTETAVEVSNFIALAPTTQELTLTQYDMELTFSYELVPPPIELETGDHFNYIIGYTDGTVRPNAFITRAEIATIFFRLMTKESRDLFMTENNSFSDVQKGKWYNVAISTLTKAGIFNGYPDGTFKPNQPITRAELAKVIAMFAKLTEGEREFSDIDGHWAEPYIRLAAGNGWILGYPDGTFLPNENLKRAEAVTMINRVLNRHVEEEENLLEGMLTFSDNLDPSIWYYFDIQEATNYHTYVRVETDSNAEKWMELIPNIDWKTYQF